jgi:hypothetical protein
MPLFFQFGSFLGVFFSRARVPVFSDLLSDNNLSKSFFLIGFFLVFLSFRAQILDFFCLLDSVQAAACVLCERAQACALVVVNM